MGTSGSIAISPNMKKVPYDPVKDLIPITQTSAQSMLVVLHPSVAINSLKDLIAFATAEPDKLAFASSGTGGSGHLAAELFMALAKVRMTHVPYKGNGPAVLAQVAARCTRTSTISWPFCRPRQQRPAQSDCRDPCETRAHPAKRPTMNEAAFLVTKRLRGMAFSRPRKPPVRSSTRYIRKW